MLAIGTQNYRMDIIFTCFLGKVWSASYILYVTQQHGPLRSYSFPSLSVTTFERPQHSHTPPVHLHFCECSLAFATEHFNICWATTLSPRPPCLPRTKRRRRHPMLPAATVVHPPSSTKPTPTSLPSNLAMIAKRRAGTNGISRYHHGTLMA